jgi:hypothetical protein
MQKTKLAKQSAPHHVNAYRGGYVGLVKKGFISASADERFFSITNAGLKAMV